MTITLNKDQAALLTESKATVAHDDGTNLTLVGKDNTAFTYSRESAAAKFLTPGTVVTFSVNGVSTDYTEPSYKAPAKVAGQGCKRERQQG